jgi:hypothetical protein
MAKLYRGIGDYQPTTTLGLKAAGEQENSRISVTCPTAGRNTEIYTRIIASSQYVSRWMEELCCEARD